MAQFEDMRDHLAEAHLAKLPDYSQACSNCREWRMLAGNLEGLAPKAVPILGGEDLLHRAGHLLYAGSASS